VPEVLVGQSAAGYQLIELVGAGGMGRVYRATQPGTGRVVALKVIRPDLASDEVFRERFRREAQLAASVDHPSVIPIYGADERDGVLFAAMRWVDGSDLRRLLAAKGPLAPARAVGLLQQLAGALDAAHAKGLIHRDIKPANVLLEGDHVFLSDFGLARSLADADQSTRTGGFIGTVDYIAPELVEGGAGGVPSDVYSLGCMFFEMVTGSVPFPVDSLLGKLHAHAAREPPVPSILRADLPRGFDEVIARVLAKDPVNRYATASQFADAAERALDTRPRSSSASIRPPRVRRWAMAMGASAALAVAAVVALLIAVGSPGPKPAAHLRTNNGRPLPAAALLPLCKPIFTAPASDCRAADGGINVVADLGSMAHMRTMDFEVTKVIQSRAIKDPVSSDTITAPSGVRFVILETKITNRLTSTQFFEPNFFKGRQTALFLFAPSGKSISWHGPESADYSEENAPAVSIVPLSMVGKRFPPPDRYSVPYTGVLVFAYPDAELRKDVMAVLAVHEFGQGMTDRRSVGVIRLPLRRSRTESVYRAAAI
jgi:serine/threonine protein kinase